MQSTRRRRHEQQQEQEQESLILQQMTNKGNTTYNYFIVDATASNTMLSKIWRTSVNLLQISRQLQLNGKYQGAVFLNESTGKRIMNPTCQRK
jgi:hypothetical protein